jgi:hypothetical protein
METFTTDGTNITSAINTSSFGMARVQRPLGANFAAGKTYEVSFDAVVTSGSFQIKTHTTSDLSAGGFVWGTISTTGSHVVRFTPTTSQEWFGLYNIVNFNFSASNFKIREVGQTASLQPTGIQLAPGQWIDQHPNAKHVIIPDGARLADQKLEGVLRGRNIFSASTTGQHMIGANLNALPLNARLTLSAIATVSGTFDIGDGVDQDRYAAGVTIGTTWSNITMLTRFHDATNRKIVLTPTSSYTGTVTSAARVERLS